MMFAQQMRAYEGLLFDADFREKALTDTEGALAEAGLTAEEIERVKHFNKFGVEWDARIRLLRVISTLCLAYPLTHLVLIGECSNLWPYEQFLKSAPYRERKSVPQYTFPHPAQIFQPFYQFMQSVLEEGTLTTPFLKDLLEYEKDQFTYKMLSVQTVGQQELIKVPDQLEDHLTPVLHQHAFLHSYDTQLDEVRKTLHRFKTPLPHNVVLRFIGEVKEETFVVFKVANGDLREYELPPLYKKVLTLCDGQHQVSDIVQALADTLTEREVKSFLAFAFNKYLIVG